jgi:DNA-dependent RNA polymerase auxiliary subunit epsilon
MGTQSCVFKYSIAYTDLMTIITLGVRDVRLKENSFKIEFVKLYSQEFLFYHQKDSDVNDDLVNPVTPWAQMMRYAHLAYATRCDFTPNPLEFAVYPSIFSLNGAFTVVN